MKYPTAQIKPVTVTFGRVSYTDNYQWLEAETPEALEWTAQQDQLTQDWLSSNPARATAEPLIAAMPSIENNDPVFSGGRWFRKRTPDNQKTQRVEVADAVKGPWRCMLDLGTLANGRKLTVDALVPSPDGRKLVLSLGVDGVELAELRVLDVDSGGVLMESIPQVYAFFAAWLPDSSGFYINARDPGAMAAGSKIYLHVLGAPAQTQPEEYVASADMMWVKASADGKHMLMIADHLSPRIEYIRDVSIGGRWRPFLQGETAQFRGDIIGDRLYAVTDDGAPCGRLVSIPLATPTDRSTWKELVPGSQNVLATLLIVDDHLVLVDLVDTWSRMRVFHTDGRLKGEIPLPGKGSLSSQQFAIWSMLDMVSRGADGDVIFPFSSPARSAAL